MIHTRYRTDQDIAALHQLAQSIPSIKSVIDLGTGVGESAKVFAQYAEWVVTIDIFPVDCEKENIVCLQGESLQYANLLTDVDLVYIDADHTYEGRLADIEAYRHKAKYIAGHDFDKEHLKRAVLDSLGKPRNLFTDGSWLS